MTIESFLSQATKTLTAAGIESARLDCLLLLEDALGQDRAYLLAHPEVKIDASTEVELNNKIVQRSDHKPLAYIRKHAAFYGREFVVSPAVLVPRPETETIIELAKKLHLPAKPTIIDIGTGSGCIGITLALEMPKSQVHIYDIDAGALAVARKNAKRYDVKVHFAQQNLLPQKPPKADLVVANLPYVPTDLPINQAAQHEPRIALFSGSDGLDLYREFWQQLSTLQVQYIITESLPSQHEELAGLAKKAGYELIASEGFAQHFSLQVQQPA